MQELSVGQRDDDGFVVRIRLKENSTHSTILYGNKEHLPFSTSGDGREGEDRGTLYFHERRRVRKLKRWEREIDEKVCWSLVVKILEREES
jgi:hypothetical protein